jgi:penicillin amidase
MRRVLRFLPRLLAGLLVLALLAAGGGYLLLRRSLPQVSGTVQVAGLRSRVEIVRDADGVPHIYASDRLDALFGLGYAHAQDRLWQLDFQRRAGQGRLSEVLGEPTVGVDRFLRTLGVHRAAKSAWEKLPAESRAAAEAYVAGINAWIDAASPGQLPVEFLLTGARPERWAGSDVVLWGKMLALDLGADYNTELLRSDIIAKVGPERAAQLLAGDGVGDFSIAAAGAESYAGVRDFDQLARRAMGLSAQTGMPTGSNSWVVGGAKTSTHAPILANDPHLPTNLPLTWYLAHLSAPGFEVAGATIPGLPAVVIGHNAAVAWGITNAPVDVEDLFRERLDPSGTQAEYQGKWEPLTVDTETVEVKGRAPVTFQVRSSRHGPLISDAMNSGEEQRPAEQRGPLREPLALRWVALEPEDGTLTALLGLNTAQSWEEFRAALSTYVAPTQNFVYADTRGNIGYYLPGLVPVRAKSSPVPAEGWSADYEWTGWVPFDQLPQAYNPPSHFIVTANNQPVPRDYPYYLGREWSPPFRAERISELLEAKATLSPDDIAAMQGDTMSRRASALVERLLKLVTPANETERRAVELLKGWDGNMQGDSTAATIYGAWFIRLASGLLEDDLGETMTRSYRTHDVFTVPFLEQALAQPSSPWCDNRATAATETCVDVANQTFRAALAFLQERYGADPGRWRWDGAHQAVFAHQLLTNVPPLQPFVDRSVGTPGDGTTVNLGGFSFEQPFQQRSGATYRQVIDLGDLQNSRFIIAAGQSGNPLSPHYADKLASWQALGSMPMYFSREAVERGPHDLLVLTPAGP